MIKMHFIIQAKKNIGLNIKSILLINELLLQDNHYRRDR